MESRLPSRRAARPPDTETAPLPSAGLAESAALPPSAALGLLGSPNRVPSKQTEVPSPPKSASPGPREVYALRTKLAQLAAGAIPTRHPPYDRAALFDGVLTGGARFLRIYRQQHLFGHNHGDSQAATAQEASGAGGLPANAGVASIHT